MKNAIQTMARVLVLLTMMALLFFAVGPSLTGQPPGKGKKGGDPAKKADMEVFHYLLDQRAHIQRTVKNLADGVETVTVSDKAEVARKIQEHAEAMHQRVKAGRGIHLRDPLFVEIFRNHDKVFMKVDRIDRGVKVRETSKDAYVVKLIQAHAAVVSNFIKNGYEEVRKNHPVPPREP